MSERRRELIVGVSELLVAAGLGVAIWVALPARYWPVDVAGSALGCAYAVGGGGLLAARRWGRRVSVISSWAALVTGIGLFSAVSLSAAYLSGLYGPVGGGGALILGAVAALLLPYLVALPALQLVLLGRKR